MPVNNLIQLRKGTETEWNLANPVLASGEPGWDITNKVLKIGDGVTSWSGLISQRVPLDKSVTSQKLADNQDLNVRSITSSVGLLVDDSINSWSITPANFRLDINSNLKYKINSSGQVVVGSWKADPIDIAYGGTNSTTASGALSNLGGAPLVHNHTASNITNFNSSVSGLLPVTNITGGSNIMVSQSGTVYSVAVTGSLGLTTEEVDDRVSNLLVAGNGINLIYDDPNNLLTISTTGLQPSGNYSLIGHNHSFEEIVTTGTYINFLPSSGNLSVALSGIDSAISGKKAAADFDQGVKTTDSPEFAAITIRESSTVSWLLDAVDNAFTFTQNGTKWVALGEDGILYPDNTLQNTAWIGTVDWSQITSGIPSTFAPSTHKSSHAIGGSDALTPSDIGAAPQSHQHNTADITNFNSSVSGLLPITNIVGGNNVSVSTSGTVYTVAVTGSLGLTTEQVDDRVASLLVAGSGINLTYDDPNNLLTISVSGLTSSATIGDGSTNVISYNLNETLNVVGSGSTTVTYNDSTNTINIGSPSLIREYELVNSTKSTFSVTGGYALNNLDVYHNGIKLLASGDYTATNGSTFDLVQPAVSGDVVEWLGYSVVPRHQLILGEVRSDTVGNINYLGRAVAGSSEGSNVWTIKRYTVADNGIDITTATANNASWTNRLSSSYI